MLASNFREKDGYAGEPRAPVKVLTAIAQMTLCFHAEHAPRCLLIVAGKQFLLIKRDWN